MSAREDLKKIYRAAIEAVNPETAIKSCLTLDKGILKLCTNDETIKAFDLDRFNKIIVVGAGKATASMAKAIEEILGNRIHAGCICVKHGTRNITAIKTLEAAHPLPDETSITGAKRIKQLLESASKDDLIIALISGGGSALLSLPPQGVTLGEKQATTDLLIKSGAAIHEINTVRKHLSLVKGGNLARAAYPATVLNLMVSDVVGDRIDIIASGPFAPDDSTYSQALGVLEGYKLTRKIPPSALAHITAGVSKKTDETGKADETADAKNKIFGKITHFVIASNIICLKAAKKEAKKLGYNTLILSSSIEGDAKQVANWHARIAMEVLSSSNPVPAPACIISGGETTVRVTGKGKGGRNMEFAMQAAPLIDGLKNVIVASIGTDGTDGPTNAAGAMADGFTMETAAKKGIDINDHMRTNDSYHFFKALGDLIVTGPTHTNVMDIRIILIP
jgi:glycerate 2-kinase